MSNDFSLDLLAHASATLEKEFSALPAYESSCDHAAAQEILAQTARRLGDNYPYFHPLYAGQMLRPPHPLARAAYALAMTVNPNNHARDGGRASSEMELEAVAQIAAIFGWPEHIGHLTSGGTFANLEALWIAGQLAPGKRIVGSEQAHYTHSRISGVLGLPFTPVPTDRRARMDLDALEAELRQGDVGAVVATVGTTAIAAVDQIDQIVALKRRYGFRLHIDAAYGGYFRLIAGQLDESTRLACQAMTEADSIVIDPHKHGLQPYGCGCVLFQDPGVGQLYKHDSPYTYFTSKELHLGEISLECSRPGAAAVALWATHRLMPPVPGGEFARGLARCRAAAVKFDALLRSEGGPWFEPLAQGRPDLDIVVWALRGGSPEESSQKAARLFDACARRDLHLALAQLPAEWFHPEWRGPLTCMRSVLMKPDHDVWLDEIWRRLTAAAVEINT